MLYEVLNEVEVRDNPEFTKHTLKCTLRSIRKKLALTTFEYVIPERVNLTQIRTLIYRFLSEPSGGDRGLSVAAALFQTFGKFFGIYAKVRRHFINASDISTGLAADIECVDTEGNLRLVIEVKERNLTLTDVKSSVQKARRASIREFLFSSPGINADDSDAIIDLFARTWASGSNLYHLSFDELINVGLALTGEAGQKDFLENIGRQLNEYNTQPRNRQRWKELLEEI